MKHLQDKTVYLRPTGNNARRYSGVNNSPRKALIVKVARVFITFKFEGSTYEEKYRIGTNQDKLYLEGFNCGYDIFETLEEYLECQLEEKLKDTIQRFFGWDGGYRKLNLDQLKAIAEIIGIELT